MKRVCVLGAESTGKTTLARALADRLRTAWVPEYGAVYEAIGRPRDLPWTTREFLHIARIRDWLEDLLAGLASRVLVCDTDTFTTARWHERYLGFRDPELERLAAARRYDLYLLCDVATPFVQDEQGFRLDGPHRRAMDEAYREHVRSLGAELVELHGTPEERLHAACRAVEALLGG